MQTSVHWLENVAFEAKSESGHQIVMDGSAEYGGENRGPRPMELILMGLGGCASFDIVTILKKSRQNVTNVVCHGVLTSGTYATQSTPNATVPFTWTTNDSVTVGLVYESAS